MNELEQKAQFARDTYKSVRDILYNKYRNYNDNLARYMTAQVMEESGWGQKPTGTYNYFGIKAKKNEPFTEVLTTESIGGKEQKIKQNFRNYNSLEEGLSGYVDLLVNNYDILNHGNSIKDYARQLKSKGYATRDDYESRLEGVYNGKTLKYALGNYSYNPPISTDKIIHTEYPDATRVNRLEFIKPIKYTPRKMNPIKRNFWTEWSRMPYKRQGGNIKLKRKIKL